MKPDSPQPEADPLADCLADRGSSETEEEVFRVLWASPGEMLVRSDVHRRMGLEARPSLVRVGQILEGLYRSGLAERRRRRAQGARRAGHYRLSSLGIELGRRLGLEREEKTLFPVDPSLLRKYLTRDRLAQCPTAPGRVFGFYGFRGGVGTTTISAHVARSLAERDSNRQILTLDLDLGAPGLDRFFAPEDLQSHRGLTGLLVGYYEQRSYLRPEWLRQALEDPKYIHRPFPDDLPQLLYLSSGLFSDSTSTRERAEALHALRQEAGQLHLDGFREISEEEGFLFDLRRALQSTQGRVVIDAESGRGLGAWITTQLADELGLCVRDDDTSGVTLGGLRAVLANYLAFHDEEGETASVFVISNQSEGGTNLDSWIEANLIDEANRTVAPTGTYRTWRTLYTSRIANSPTNWCLTELFESLTDQLESRQHESSGIASPELQALLNTLDPALPLPHRSVAAGLLANAELEDLARCIATYVHNPSLHKYTDTNGRKMVRTAMQTVGVRLFSSVMSVTGIGAGKEE